MVYIPGNQLNRYHQRPESHLTTHDHFYDGNNVEAPAPEFRNSPHKKSTYGKLYNGSTFHGAEKQGQTIREPKAKATTLKLFPTAFQNTTQSVASSTFKYQGNGSFTVSTFLKTRHAYLHKHATHTIHALACGVWCYCIPTAFSNILFSTVAPQVPNNPMIRLPSHAHHDHATPH